MSTPRADVDDDVIPEFDFSLAIPRPFVGLIGPSYRICSHGEGSDRPTYSVISTERDDRQSIEFVDPCDSGLGRTAC